MHEANVIADVTGIDAKTASIVDVPGIDAGTARNELDIDGLQPLQRLLLSCDGTLTDLIEVLAREPIRLVKLEHRVAAAPADVAMLELEAGEPMIERSVQLQGVRSGVIHVYAESHIAALRLPARLRHSLAATEMPLGRLCKQHRLEVFKEPIGLRRERAQGLSARLQVDPDAVIVSRAYRAFSGGRPLMVIREYFAPALWGIESAQPSARQSEPPGASKAGPRPIDATHRGHHQVRPLAAPADVNGDQSATAGAREGLWFWL